MGKGDQEREGKKLSKTTTTTESYVRLPRTGKGGRMEKV